MNMNTPYSAQARIDFPLGAMLLACTQQGLAGLWFVGQKHEPVAIDAPLRPDNALLCETARQLLDYWAGERTAFDLPLDAQGTPFQRSVWQAMLHIPLGQTTSYGALARSIGAAHAVRAVGAAVGRNPISIIVPCHRVLGSDGSLTGYAGGLDRKTALLRRERVPAGALLRNAAPLAA